MNAGNELAISLSVYLSLSKNDMLKKTKQNKTKQNNTKQKAKRPRKKKKKISSEGSRTSDLRRKRATRYPSRQGHFKCLTETLYLTQFQFFAHEILPVDAV